MNNKYVVVKLSTWIGTSIGAIHIYAKLHWYDAQGDLHITNLEHPLSAGEARELNKIERDKGYGTLYKRLKGDMYDGFWTSDDARAFAIDYVNKNMPDIMVILIGDESFGECLWARDESIKTKLNILWGLNEQLYTSAHYGFTHIPKKNLPKHKRLFKTYHKLLDAI